MDDSRYSDHSTVAPIRKRCYLYWIAVQIGGYEENQFVRNASLIEALSEAKERFDELAVSSYQNADDALKRYYHVIRSDSVVGEALAEILPEADFDACYEAVKATQGGSIGSAHANTNSNGS